jgi:uncharacterized protein (TIGR02145 family)
MKMKYCPNCGAEAKEMRYCSSCGTSLQAGYSHGYQPQPKSQGITFTLCFFLGGLGAHRFYVGKIGTGLLMLLFNVPSLIIFSYTTTALEMSKIYGEIYGRGPSNPDLVNTVNTITTISAVVVVFFTIWILIDLIRILTGSFIENEPVRTKDNPPKYVNSGNGEPIRTKDNKSQVTSFILCFFLGGFGAHRVYVGKTGTGFLILLFTVSSIIIFWNISPVDVIYGKGTNSTFEMIWAILSVILVIWILIDLIRILTGNFFQNGESVRTKDSNPKYVNSGTFKVYGKVYIISAVLIFLIFGVRYFWYYYKENKLLAEAKAVAVAEAEADAATALQKADSIEQIVRNVKVSKTSFIDPRDNKEYKAVTIGSQTWMAENLNYNAGGSKCYDKKTTNCNKYGRLYNWKSAMMACPKGWHLPSAAEWDVLMAAVGGEKTGGKYLKATSGWNDNGNGKDKLGFSALPGGSGSSGGSFIYAGYNGNWWSASEYSSYLAYYRVMDYIHEDVYYISNGKSDLFSVRCLQN